MANVWCVRAEFGTYTKQFVEGGYVAIGWMPNSDLSGVKTRDDLYPRAGDATNGILIIQGMESIDASVVGDDLLAHSYVGQTDVLKDHIPGFLHESRGHGTVDRGAHLASWPGMKILLTPTPRKR